ncbi:ERCC4 domain-containing protein [Sulfodiicoccus acidiphilus]|uniref:ERCC4 domain-containing protein n=1 Tax=Sulfodiicoccus acidiphilus TaxID=1670455 RepID=UPI0013156EEE|nr:ERCC4 domain-containing protein [Sulfodiicoccus acidiphilus]
MVRIYVDVREKASGVPDRLGLLGVTVIVRQLTVADYVLAEGVGLERKSVRDLASSVFDGRLFDQAERLSESYRKAFLLIEGDLGLLERYVSNFKAIDLAVASVVADYDLRLVYSRDQEESAQILKKLAEKLQEGRASNISLHSKPKLSTLREKQLYLLQSLPNVGPKLSQRILDRFPTLAEFFEAPLPKLEEVLGRAKAEEVFKLLHSSSKGKRDSNNSLLDYLESSKDEGG